MRRFFLGLLFALGLSPAFGAYYLQDKVFPEVCLNDRFHWCIQTDASAGFSASGTGEFNNSTAGTAASLAGPSSNYVGSTAGWLQQTMGTTTTGNVTLRSNSASLSFGYGVARFFLRGREITASTGSEQYTERLGFLDADGAAVDGCFFRYNEAVNSGKWEIVCRQAGVETAQDSGITFTASTNRTYEIIVNAAGTSATFYVGGTAVSTPITTNIPTGTNYTGCGWTALKSLGTTSVVPMGLDRMACQIDLTTARW